MKKLLCILLCVPLLLAGCSDEDSQEKKMEQLISETFSTDKYDSHVTFVADTQLNDSDFSALSKALEERVNRALADKNSDYPSYGHQMQTSPEEKRITIYFNNTANLTEEFMQNVSTPNKIEFRKGNKPDGEVILTTEDIYDAYADHDAAQPVLWNVVVKMSGSGSSKFSKVTKELAGSNTPITIWLDGKAIYSPKVNEHITNGTTVITGGEITNEQTAKALAYRLRSGALPSTVTMQECSLGSAK